VGRGGQEEAGLEVGGLEGAGLEVGGMEGAGLNVGILEGLDLEEAWAWLEGAMLANQLNSHRRTHAG
jgi:hypothetical protein